MNRKINQILLDLRKKNRKTQEDLAIFLGIETSGYGKLERGVTDITLTKIEKLASFYGMSVIDFISYPDKYIHANEVINAQIDEKVSVTIELKKEKKDQVLKLIFGENNLEILNK